MKRFLAFALCLSLSGMACNVDLFKPRPPDPTPPPVVVVEADGAACLKNYGRGLADAFDVAAGQFERGVLEATINKEMGDAQAKARVDAFMPLMQQLQNVRGEAERAKLLRKFASELRQVK